MRWFFAPAKINLWLHVLGRRADGFHQLDSLVAFARVGDRLGFSPGGPMTLKVSGPQAAKLPAAGDNLVLRAAEELAARAPNLKLGAFALVKNLPLASGLGGGSSDAAAALRALCAANRLALDDPRMAAAALATGSDVPACLNPQARLMRGRGETLSEALALPALHAILVNPGAAVSTPAVFDRLGFAPGETPPRPTSPAGATIEEQIRHARNDLEAPAMALEPKIAEAIERLNALPGVTLVRMSGSGATCFALFADARTAALGAARLRRQRPEWWVRATRLR